MRSTSPTGRSRLASRSKLENIVSTAAKLKASVYISEETGEKEALDSFQTWLQVPLIPQASEDELIASSSPELRYVQEPTFETSDDAVFAADTTPEHRQAVGRVVWRRVTGNLHTASNHHCRLVQGCLHGSTWFLGALAAVSCKQDLLLSLIVSDDRAQRGLYTFQFFKHGSWRQVVVDNRLPCLEQQQRLACSSSGQAQELWPSLLEKAYARLHGGYAAIASGNVGDALVDLTGGVVSKISLADEGHMADAATGALWTLIEQWLAAGSIIACMAKHAAGEAAGSMCGILANTPYSILSAKALPSGTKLLRIHCPWAPEGVWQGAWGPYSAGEEWLGEEGQLAISKENTLAAGLQDDATFWCSYWDFIQVFNRCWVVQLMPTNWHQISLAAGWMGAGAGGPAAAATGAAALLGVASTKTALHRMTFEAAAPRPGTQSSSKAGVLSSALGITKQHRHQHDHQQTPAGVPVSMSSSWCCNPQFRLTVLGSSSIVVCLGQRDPQVLAKGHKPKKQRDFLIGLTLLHTRPGNSGFTAALNGRRSPSPAASRGSPSPLMSRGSPGSTMRHGGGLSGSPSSKHGNTIRPVTAAAAGAGGRSGRIWVPQQHVLADTGLSNSREVVLRFKPEPGESYMLVPYTGHAGDTGPFTLRVYGPHAMQLEQLPSPLSLVIGGQWQGCLAGGRSIHASWGSNPQYLISCQRETTALLALLRPDMTNNLVPQPYDPMQCIGLTLAAPEPTATGWGRRCCITAQSNVVYAESDYTAMDEAVLQVRLQPEQPYVLVPSTAEPGIAAPFELRVLSDHPVELVPLPEMQTTSATGSWGAGSAGGSNLHASFFNNPAYRLRLQHKAVCRINLTRLGRGWSCNQPLGDMIGFYILKPFQGAAAAATAQRGRQQRTTSFLKQAQLFESAFLPTEGCEQELQLPAGVLLLVPCTYAPGVHGRFCLTVTAEPAAGLGVEAVPGGVEAALHQTHSQ